MLQDGIAVVRLGYDSIVSYRFPDSGRVAMCTGSSLNRQRYEGKQTDQAIKEKAAALRAKNRAGVAGIGYTGNEYVRGDQVGESGNFKVRRKKQRYSISRNAKQLIRSRGAALYRCGRCKTIVTLSFIAPVTDKQAIRCLQNYIRSWRHSYGTNINYLWVAERQDNGNPHFHILTSHFFDIEKENARWVRVQYNQGLVYEKDGHELERWEIETMIQGGYLQDQLNPFDVKKISSQAGVISYLTKYITKNKGKKTGGGKQMDSFEFHPWRCSHRVSRIFTGILAQKETMPLMMSWDNVRVQKRDYVKDGKVKYKKGFVHYPVPYFGLWAVKIQVYNQGLAGDQYRVLDEVNKKILIAGDKPEIEFIDEFNFYSLFCRDVTVTEINLANEGVYVNDMVGVTDRLYRNDKGDICSDSFEGPARKFGRYRLRNGSYHVVCPYTKDELIAMQ